MNQKASIAHDCEKKDWGSATESTQDIGRTLAKSFAITVDENRNVRRLSRVAAYVVSRWWSDSLHLDCNSIHQANEVISRVVALGTELHFIPASWMAGCTDRWTGEFEPLDRYVSGWWKQCADAFVIATANVHKRDMALNERRLSFQSASALDWRCTSSAGSGTFTTLRMKRASVIMTVDLIPNAAK
jgi:hypothetical protein